MKLMIELDLETMKVTLVTPLLGSAVMREPVTALTDLNAGAAREVLEPHRPSESQSEIFAAGAATGGDASATQWDTFGLPQIQPVGVPAMNAGISKS